MHKHVIFLPFAAAVSIQVLFHRNEKVCKENVDQASEPTLHKNKTKLKVHRVHVFVWI